MVDTLIENLRVVVGRHGVLAERDEMLVFECDGLPQHKFLPRAVVFPRSTEEVAEVVSQLARARVPFAPRGAGTGLSGGALALNQAVIIEMARMRRLLKMDPDNRLAIVETGMVNAQLSRAAAPYGLHYVPDPSSQVTCTIGGNIAENAGGIHCLKYGMTVDHVLGARVVLANGDIVDLHGAGSDTVGYDLLGVFIGSEGTFGIATEATLRLAPLAPAVRTLLADFVDVDDASRAVSAIIAAGFVPAALEMVDGATIRAVEASVFAAGIPTDAEAALLIELDGLEAGLDEEAERAESVCRQHGARNVRRAADEQERKKLWAARKGAFGAMGRISPDLMLQDTVVPRSRLPEVLAETYRIGAKYNLLVANVFHAGDGNLHPYICFDSRNADEVQRVKEAGREIMETCVRAGGTITGEHGVGIDKSDYLPLIFNADDMDVMLRVRAAFDPSGLCNPGKIIPTSRSCGEARAAQSKTKAQRPETTVEPNGSDSIDARQVANSGVFTPATSHSNLRGSTLQRRSSSNEDTAYHSLAQIVGAENISGTSNGGHTLTVAPASAEEACEVLRLASREGWAVAPAGAGTWLDVGNVMRPTDVIIATRRMQRMIEHEPADLVATAEAGVALAALNAELRQARQWLPLDPPDDGQATIGGVAATGIAGAQSFAYGAPRNSVIGMRVALADGRIIKAGGRVVKNVAGYDLCKLFVGSYGTLGLILELTFKLRPTPLQEATMIVAGSHTTLWRCARAVLAAQLFPIAVEMVSPRVASSIASSINDTHCALLIRFAGTPQAIGFQTEYARTLLHHTGHIEEVTVLSDDTRLWRDVAAMPFRDDDPLVWRANVRPIELGALLDAAMANGGETFHSSSLWQAGIGDGRLRVASVPAKDSKATVTALERLRQFAYKAGGTLVVESAPLEVKKSLDAWGDVGAATSVMQRVKQQLDPEDTFCPGRFVAGI